MRTSPWLTPLLLAAVLLPSAPADAVDDISPSARVKRARMAFDKQPESALGELRGSAAFDIRLPRDDLAIALGVPAQPIRITLAETVLFDGVDTSGLQVGRRGRRKASRVRPGGDDRLRIDVRRGRIHLRVRNALLDGMIGATPTGVLLEVRVGECAWYETLLFDRRGPRSWSIRRVRLSPTEIRDPRFGRGGRVASAWVLRTRNQVVELQRRYGQRSLRYRRLDFTREMVVAALSPRQYSTIEWGEPRISQDGLDITITDHRLGDGCYVAFFAVFVDPVYRVVPRTFGNVVFEPRIEFNHCR